MEKFTVFMPGLETESSKLAAQRAMHSQYVLQLLHLQRKAGFLCDITVNIEDKSFKAHKPLLAACSLYFRALFADADSAQTSSINLTKLSPTGFEVLLDYIYSGSLAITTDNSDQVLYAANCLQMTNVVETCLNFIRSSFQVSVNKDVLSASGFPSNSNVQQPRQQENSLKIPDSTQINLHSNTAESAGCLDTTLPNLHSSNSMTQPPVMKVPQQTMENHEPDSVSSSLLSNPHLQTYPQMIPQHVQSISASVDLPNTTIAGAQQLYAKLPATDNNPSHDDLAKLMPYLIAKNARRPTLKEVQQLLVNSKDLPPESTERFLLKQVPPSLMQAFRAEKAVPNTPDAPVDLGSNFPANNNQVDELMDKTNLSSSRLVECNTTNQTTAHTVMSINVNNSSKLQSKDLQPFVLIQPTSVREHEDTDLPKLDESSKSSTWSEDRSVSQDTTDLSGTPCSATVTEISHPILTHADDTHSELSAVTHSSYSPQIQISPRSVESLSSLSSPKSRVARAMSLDLSTQSSQSDSADRQTSRSVGSQPLDMEMRTHPCLSQSKSDDGNSQSVPEDLTCRMARKSASPSNRISLEQANNAIGALYVGRVPESNSLLSDNKVDEATVDEEFSLVIAEENVLGTTDTEADVTKSDSSSDEEGFPVPSSKEAERDKLAQGDTLAEDEYVLERRVIKQEKRISSTSPPPIESFTRVEEEMELEKDIAGANCNNSNESVSNMNLALDLSLPKTAKSAPIKITNITNGVSPLHPAERDVDPEHSSTKDEKIQEALDALVMMNSRSNVGVTPSQPIIQNQNTSEENSLTVGFSRKPRRSSGGQTCQWPGCGRLFRHRNIYEEHQKLHVMGVPVSQLRKCYMGARVKKTARERLEEMRMVDSASQNTNHGVAEHENGVQSFQRVSTYGRKRKSNQMQREERKRVTVKDRKEHVNKRNQAWMPTNENTVDEQQHRLLSGLSPAIPQSIWQENTLVMTSISNQAQPGINPGGSVSLAQQHHQAAQMSLAYDLSRVDHQSIRMPSMALHPVQQSPPNNAAVAATLAALGIQLPVKRGAENPPPRLSKPGALTPAMTLDDLRKQIALREGLRSGNIDLSAQNFALPAADTMNPKQPFTVSPTKLGNVPGISPDFLQNQAPQNQVRMSVPNPYHSQMHASGHGPTCS